MVSLKFEEVGVRVKKVNLQVVKRIKLVLFFEEWSVIHPAEGGCRHVLRRQIVQRREGHCGRDSGSI